MTKLDSILKIRDITLLTEVHIVKAMIFPVVTYRFEKWTIKKAECWRIDVFEEEKILESPLDSKEIKPVNPQGNQAWMFIGRNDAEAEAPILWAADVKNWLTGKDPDARKDWRQKEKWVAEHEMLGWHHQFHIHEFKLQEIVKGRETWCAIVHGVTQSRTWLSDWTMKERKSMLWRENFVSKMLNLKY